MLYFSCHGIKDKNGQLYFAAKTTDRKKLRSTGIPANFVNDVLDQCRAQQKVVLLDCCYSGAFEKGRVVRADEQVNATECFGRGSVIITASDAMQYAFEGDEKVETVGKGSYFTNALIEGLESGTADVNNDGKITYSELYNYVYDLIRGITPDQTPTLNIRGVEGDFVLFKNLQDDLGSVKGTQTRTAANEDTTTVTSQVEHDSFFKFIQEARMYLEQEQYDKAIKKFDGILALSEGHIEALNGKGVAFCRQEKYEEALECFKEVLKIKPKHPEANSYVKIITDRISKERNAEVKSSGEDIKQDTALEKRTEEKVIRALDQSAQIPSELIKKGDEFLGKRMYEDAILCYDQALKIEPRSESAWYSKGLAFYYLSRYEEAIICYDKALEIEPDYSSAWNNKGLALFRLGKYEEAIICYDKALELNPNHAEAWYNKGFELRISGNFEEALKCYDKALEIEPNHAEAWFWKGRTMFRGSEEALKCYDKALEINPNHAQAWWYKGNELDYIDKSEEALKCYDKALEISPRSSLYWSSKGQILAKLGRYEEAVKCYDKAIEISPDEPLNEWLGKGEALNMLGRYEEAIKCYDKAIDFSPEYNDAWNNKGNALSGLGRYEEAIKCYDKALEIEPNHVDAWNNKGSILHKLHRDEEALICYDKAIEIIPKDADTWRLKGNFLEDLGREKDAEKCYKKAKRIENSKN